MPSNLLVPLLIAAGVIALALLARALFVRRFPAPKKSRGDLLTHEDERLSTARRRELEARRDEARAEIDRTMPPPGSIGG